MSQKKSKNKQETAEKIRILSAKLDEILKNENTDDEVRKSYHDEFLDCIRTKGIIQETVALAAKGIELDNGEGFLEYLDSAGREKLNDLSKSIKKVFADKTIKRKNAFSFYFLLLKYAVEKDHQEELVGSIIRLIGKMLSDEKHPLNHIDKDNAFSEYFYKWLSSKVYPEWDQINTDSEETKLFIREMDRVMENKAEDQKKLRLSHWLRQGLDYANKRGEIENIEKKIPSSRVQELNDLANHFEDIEKRLRDSVYEVAKKESIIEVYKKETEELKTTQNSPLQEKSNLEKETEQLRQKNEIAKQQLEETQRNGKALDALGQNEKKAMLEEIANSLKNEYREYKSSVGVPMDNQLGEIYRDKVGCIFRILNRHGIRME